ncbi:serine hydrolase [Colwellia sp. MB02u-9]|uniref:serine hydrolase domain-containing protein n=1 Tax=Colwellia sp. MB02u-9 TaxID=2759823 RepID=UPI0015F53C96|nr:serine hydrolase domain-containing protein [Colwellia sp. MB02u-9]MBA6296384.1 beta-lactamase family protein [Colwellia sp. MB02u-9]
MIKKLAFLSLFLIPPVFAQTTLVDKLKIEQQVKSFMAKENIPAIAVGIIQQGKVVFTSGLGVRDRETKQAINSKTLFQIGSQSKVLTSIITLELIDKGELKLTDRVIDLLPDAFPKNSLSKFESLTIEHLLTHRSGLPNYPKNVTRIDGDAFLGGYDEQMLLSALKVMKLSFKVNEKWDYSNFNYALLGYVLSKVTNKNYAQLVKYYISDKYELPNTLVNLSESQKNTQQAFPYRKDDRQVLTKPWDMGLLTPHGGVYSSIDDMAHLMVLQMKAYSLFSKSGENSPLVSTQIKYDTKFTQGGEKYPGLSYGLGMFEASNQFPLFSETVLFHGGDLDGYGCEYLFSPEYGVGVVMLTSSGGGKFVNFGRQMMRELLEISVK